MENILSIIMNQYESFPDLLDSKDLIGLALYRTPNDAYLDRKHCKGPPFIVINGRNIRYPKDDFIAWLKEEKETNKTKFNELFCWRCERFYDRSKFYQNKSPCKECHKKIIRDWQKRNPDRILTYRENERAKNFCMKKIKKWYGAEFVSSHESKVLNIS